VAKAFYNTARLKDTSDAIRIVQFALTMAHPDDLGIGHRFSPSYALGPSKIIF